MPKECFWKEIVSDRAYNQGMDVRQVASRIRAAILLAGAMTATVGARAQDLRTVTEPAFPPICTTLTATMGVTSGEPAGETVSNTAPDTSRIQSALNACASGQAVELAATGTNVAFLSGSIAIPSGRTLIVDGGVTLFASRNGADFQITPATGIDTCGVNGPNGNGCNAFITIGQAAPGGTSTSTGSGLMGYGIVNGRGQDKLISGGAVGTESWWDLANDARTGTNVQNNPILIQMYKANSSVIYKVSLLNSPHFHVKNQYSAGFTVWDAKIITPWTARNTDGIDPTGTTNMSVINSFIGDGDDEIAISGSTAATGFSFTNLQFMSGHGLSIGSITTNGVSNVLANGLYFAGQSADSNQEALHIKSAQDRGGLVQNITYQNVCIKNVKNPIDIDPFYNSNSGSIIPQYQNIVFQNVHVLTEGNISLQGHDASNPVTMTFNNVVFDVFATKDINSAVTQSTGKFNPQYLTISGTGVVSPTQIANLDSTTSFSHSTGVTYSPRPTVSSASAYSCPASAFATLITEMYASSATATNLQSVSLTNPGSITLNATVEPTNSETSHTDVVGGVPSTYTGVAVPTGTVKFFEGATLVGTGTFGANGTLASATITNPSVGTHTYTSTYSGDGNYAAASFGSITLTVSAGAAAQLAYSTAPAATLVYGNNTGTVAVAVQDGAGDATTSTAAVTITVKQGATTVGTYTVNAVSGTATFNLSAVLPVGSYTYTASSTGLTQAVASESVTAATLTVTATAASRVFDAVNPSFGYSITGFVNSDTSAVVSGSPVITTSAVRTSAPGSYATNVAQGTLSAANYNFLLVGGTLTVTGGAAQMIVFAPLPNFPHGATYQLVARTTSGAMPTYTVSGPATVSGSALTVTGSGAVTVTAASASNTKYAAATPVAQSFTAQ